MLECGVFVEVRQLANLRHQGAAPRLVEARQSLTLARRELI